VIVQSKDHINRTIDYLYLSKLASGMASESSKYYTVACWYMNKKPETLADNYIDDINSTPIVDYEV